MILIWIISYYFCKATGVRSIAFHPDGRALFTGHEDGLKVKKVTMLDYINY